MSSSTSPSASRRRPPRRTEPRHERALHEVRKAAKGMRYAAETFEPVIGKPARRIAQRFVAIHEMLGTGQDAVVARDLLRRARGQGEHAAGAQRLHLRPAGRARGGRFDQAAHRLPALWKAASAPSCSGRRSSPVRPSAARSARARPVSYRPASLANDPARLLDVHSGDRARDHEPLDLARSFEDRVDLRVAVPALDGVVTDVPGAPEDLDRLFCHRRLPSRWRRASTSSLLPL